MKFVLKNSCFLFLVFLLIQLVQPMETDSLKKKPRQIEHEQFARLPIELQHFILWTAMDGELGDFQEKRPKTIERYEDFQKKYRNDLEEKVPSNKFFVCGDFVFTKIDATRSSSKIMLLLKKFYCGYLFVKNNDETKYLLSKKEVKFFLRRLAIKFDDIFHCQLEIPKWVFRRRFFNNKQPKKTELQKLMNSLLVYRFTVWGRIAAGKIVMYPGPFHDSRSCFCRLERGKYLKLNLARHKINDLEGLEKYNLTHLNQLLLAGNRLKSVPENIVQLTNLSLLDLSCNRLTMLSSVEKLTNLRQLLLSRNRFKVLPVGMENLANLKVLLLKKNQLKVLPDSIGHLINLEEFDISKNKLTILPVVIGSLTSLKKLFLHKNQLERVPDSIGNLTNLEELGLSRNHLAELSESIGNLTMLKDLSLSCNKLEILPTTIGNLIHLKRLLLYRNQLERLPESIKFFSLEFINLAKNNFNQEEKEKIKARLKGIRIRI